MQTIVIGADHRGFKLKEEIKSSLSEWGFLIDDVGAERYDPEDDHPDFARAMGERLHGMPGGKGILLCGSGVGIAVAANKMPGIRAGMCLSEDQAHAARSDSDANVLVLAADYVTAPLARRIAKKFLETEFQPKERYVRRLKKIKEMEKMPRR